MIYLYLFSAVLGGIAFIVLKKLSLLLRLAIGVGVFLLIAFACTMTIMYVGDKPSPDSVVVDPWSKAK